jgi:phage replication-related protein YjqB (UPF0714/DUF867 family)
MFKKFAIIALSAYAISRVSRWLLGPFTWPITVQVQASEKSNEHCSVDPATLKRVGGFGRQILLERVDNPKAYALFTVTGDYMPTGARICHIGPDGHNKRLPGSSAPPFSATYSTTVTRDGKFTESLKVTGKRIAILAPHGGAIEEGTKEQADSLAAALSGIPLTLWTCDGRGPDAFEHWHITSAEISEESFPELKKAMANGPFDYSISFHGWEKGTDIGIGGLAPDLLKQDLKSAIDTAMAGTDPAFSVEVLKKFDDHSGHEPSNIVNRKTSNGVQLEQSPRARDLKIRQKIVEAVAGVYRERLGL